MDAVVYINPYKQFNGIFMPEWMFQTSLTANARFVYAFLAKSAGDNGECFPGQDTIAKYLGISVKSVERVISELKKEGFIESERRKDYAGRTNRYLFIEQPVMRQIIEAAVPDSTEGSSSLISEGSSSRNPEGSSSPKVEGSHSKEKAPKEKAPKEKAKASVKVKVKENISSVKKGISYAFYKADRQQAIEVCKEWGRSIYALYGEDEELALEILAEDSSVRKDPYEEAGLTLARVIFFHIAEAFKAGKTGNFEYKYMAKRYADIHNPIFLKYDTYKTVWDYQTGGGRPKEGGGITKGKSIQIPAKIRYPEQMLVSAVDDMVAKARVSFAQLAEEMGYEMEDDAEYWADKSRVGLSRILTRITDTATNGKLY